jgi:hypothetical protein
MLGTEMGWTADAGVAICVFPGAAGAWTGPNLTPPCMGRGRRRMGQEAQREADQGLLVSGSDVIRVVQIRWRW